MKTLFRLSLLVVSLTIFWNMLGCGGSGGGNDESGGTPLTDTDNDGLADVDDPDDDGDGVLDVSDAFPQDVSEWSDLDGDGIGDNADDDADGDGVLNDIDCNDLDASVYPEATDLPDDALIDSNCDGIDGDRDLGIWVSASEGNDANTGTIDAPVQTITQGITLAKALPAGTRSVYVVQGIYSEDILVTDDVSLYGGYGLLSAGERDRNIEASRATVLGADGVGQVTLTFDGTTALAEYTLLVQNSVSTIDALRFQADDEGTNIFLYNASGVFKNSDVLDQTPSGSRGACMGIAVVFDGAPTEDLNIQIYNNRINLLGTENTTDGKTLGVLALPLKDADKNLTLNVTDNVITSTGQSEVEYGIYAADDNDLATVSAVGDDRANVNLIATHNTISLQSTATLQVGINGGSVFDFNVASDADHVLYLGRFDAQENTVTVSGGIMSFGIVCQAARESAVIANNLIKISGSSADFLLGAGSSMSNADVYYNTISVEGTGVYLAGYFSYFDDSSEFSAYLDRGSTGSVVNNIFLVNSSGYSNCIAGGIEEVNFSSDASFLHRVSPAEVENNDLIVSSDCLFSGLYVDVISTSPGFNIVTTAETLNAKTGFLSDDPTIFANNISADPQFTNASSGDYSLQATSPCIDAGLEFETGWLDINGTARPQGVGVDMGAWEQ